MAATAMFLAACSGSSSAQTPEEEVMFMVFGVRDKDVADGVNVVKTSDTPLTMEFRADEGTLMTLGVTKEDDCRYVVDMKPANAEMPLPRGKIRFDLSGLQKVTYERYVPSKGMGVTKLEGAELQCIETPNKCADASTYAQGGPWEAHFGPVVQGNSAESKKAHQQALDAAVADFKANVCKP
ncbi:hypothetical protein JVX98_12735 [Ensifer sp. PDNC004]|uniref:hypothetical protein n=1 Tax=Ensifer sp. PDNC004 TaxID=2811423 RepID=UPI001964B3C0|nr:hypothetical protein [Ensifer sp. PDNC004]QRY69091.1 hypothetical protein JVX98_12735 [Ensifer sp. PDNC004]